MDKTLGKIILDSQLASAYIKSTREVSLLDNNIVLSTICNNCEGVMSKNKIGDLHAYKIREKTESTITVDLSMMIYCETCKCYPGVTIAMEKTS